MTTQIPEAELDLAVEARRLRDAVYEQPISDERWDQVKGNWIKDIHWLRWTAEQGRH